jgi:uncharacterized protein (TIGR03435 family)
MRASCLTALALLSAAAWAQRSETLPSFEVASIRLSTDKTGFMTFGPLGTGTYTIGGVMLYGLVQQAYQVPYEQISGIEKLGSERYDVTAKAGPGVLLTPENLAPRMQRLLAERFKLAVHKENKVFDGYALVVGKGGPRLTPTAGGQPGGSIFPGGLRLMNTPVSSFATSLRSLAGRPVVDKTGTEGKYDFTLSFARLDDPDSTLPSFFTALQEQLGLKLEPAKVPLDLVVIDHVERIPTEN